MDLKGLGGRAAGSERSESDGRFIPLCPLDAGLSDRDRLGHRSIGLVMSAHPNLLCSAFRQTRL
jgi:hypothetical protein